MIAHEFINHSHEYERLDRKTMALRLRAWCTILLFRYAVCRVQHPIIPKTKNWATVSHILVHIIRMLILMHTTKMTDEYHTPVIIIIMPIAGHRCDQAIYQHVKHTDRAFLAIKLTNGMKITGNYILTVPAVLRYYYSSGGLAVLVRSLSICFCVYVSVAAQRVRECQWWYRLQIYFIYK